MKITINGYKIFAYDKIGREDSILAMKKEGCTWWHS